jgi:hypothetical protein
VEFYNVHGSSFLVKAATETPMIDFPTRGLVARCFVCVGLAMVCFGLAIRSAQADKIKHPTAVFSGLDKITGRIISFEVATDETVQFGSLQITERVCYTRPPTETPQTTTFVEVDEVDTKNEYKRIFSGWMFAASPGLHGIEHPIYDIWLTDCKGGTEIIASPPETAEAEPPPPPDNAKAAPKPGTQRLRRSVTEDNPDAFPSSPGTPPPSTSASGRGPIEVGAPPGLIPTPEQRRAPTQRFYPTTPSGHDPAGNGGF